MADKSGLMHLGYWGSFSGKLKSPAATPGELLTERQPPDERWDDQ